MSAARGRGLLLLAAGLAAAPAVGEPEACPTPGGAPAPEAVPVTATPIRVASAPTDYFVLYAGHEVSGEEREVPVAVVRGQAGTTTLGENVAALPVSRYRVEKYRVGDPADVDGDCIDDLADSNPVNAAPPIDPVDGAVLLEDAASFEALAFDHPQTGNSYLKLLVFDWETDRPGVYFQNAKTHPGHFTFAAKIGRSLNEIIAFELDYDPNLVAPDGTRGVYYYYWSLLQDARFADLVPWFHTVLAASMPLIDDNLAFYVPNSLLPHVQPWLSAWSASRVRLLFEDDLSGPDADFVALNPGVGLGLLRALEPDERPHPRDIGLYETLPNELPRLAGIISATPQTPLSHVNLRAIQSGIPNAYVRGALEDPDIDSLLDSYVRYTVTADGWSLREATVEEVLDHYADSRPPAPQTPERDLSVREIAPLRRVSFDDWDAFGVKAANVAELGRLGFPPGTVPEGFAIPFAFYDEFMKANGLYDEVREMLAEPGFSGDFDLQEKRLKDLRSRIRKAETAEWMIEALREMHASWPDSDQSLRYRSSTNNEDLPGFNGAGLYDSYTQHPEETVEDGIDKSLKQVFSSLWNFRAFTEREFFRIDHLEAAMGVLVHPNFEDERANGVAVSFDPFFGRPTHYYVNTQLGEDLVTNPEARSVPEELLLSKTGTGDDLFVVLALSNLAPPGELLMSESQLDQLRRHLSTIHDHFQSLYGPAPGERFAMEIEFKITKDDVLSIKQARPWVFGTGVDGEPPPPDGACVADDVTLCLLNSRFAVTVEWSNPEGRQGPGFAVHEGTGDSGLFRFFDSENWEVLIKVLDGCEANGRAWVFAASTTDLGLVIRVEDTAPGSTDPPREYASRPGTAAPAITDTAAFRDVCRGRDELGQVVAAAGH